MSKKTRINKRTTHRQYLFGDFDGDGVKNIDDYKPFNKKKSKWPDAKKNPRFYHKARYGGFDTKFSDVLLNIEQNNNHHGRLMQDFIKENPKTSGRVKTVPSTIGKLAKQGLADLHDVAGVKVITTNKRTAKKQAMQIRNKHRNDPKEYDNFYHKPGKGGYRAYHIGLLGTQGRRCEVQVKSKPFDELSVRMHDAYKKGVDLTPFEKEAKRLAKLGF